MQKEYFVQWEIGVMADSHEDAARKALAIHRDPNSTATVFDVITHSDEETTRIDISEIDLEIEQDKFPLDNCTTDKV